MRKSFSFLNVLLSILFIRPGDSISGANIDFLLEFVGSFTFVHWYIDLISAVSQFRCVYSMESVSGVLLTDICSRGGRCSGGWLRFNNCIE